MVIWPEFCMLQHRKKGHREDALHFIKLRRYHHPWLLKLKSLVGNIEKLEIFLLESPQLESFRLSLQVLIELGKFSEQFQTFKSSPCLLRFDFSNFVLDFPTVQLSFPTSAKIERPETSRN